MGFFDHSPYRLFCRILLWTACLASAALSSAETFGVEPERPPQATFYDTEVRSLASSYIEQEYLLFIALPRGYEDSERRYPVLYVLDADILFGTITETARLLPLEGFFLGHQKVPDLIVVGVAYPGGVGEMVQKRERDFGPTAEFAADSPDGAAHFFSFLNEQGIPFVDETYRTDPGDRALIGTSTAGLFVLDTLLRHPGTFQRYVAASPRMDEIIFQHEAAYAGKPRDLSGVLYLSSGTEGDIEQQIAVGVERFHANLSARKYASLKLFHETLAGENHVSAQPTAFTHGLKAVYGQVLATAPPVEP